MTKIHKTAAPGSFFHKRHVVHSQGRRRIDILTLEEGLWLLIGLAFGWFAGHGLNFLLLFLPIGLFIAWAYEHWHASAHGGHRYIHNAVVGKKK